MVYPKFGEFIVEAKRRKLFVQVSTNGILLARHAELLVERGVEVVTVSPDGTASPCLHVMAGNIREQSMAEIWNGLALRKFRKLVAEKLLPGCSRCCNRSFCVE